MIAVLVHDGIDYHPVAHQAFLDDPLGAGAALTPLAQSRQARFSRRVTSTK
jgi:hypothetical protein